MEKIVKWVIGDVEKITFEERILNSTSFIAACVVVLFIGQVTAIWGLGPELVFIVVAAFAFVSIFYLSRFKRKKYASYLFVICYPIAAGTAFFTFGGIDSNLAFCNMFSFVICVRILPKRHEAIYTVLFIIFWCLLVLSGYLFPQSVTPWPSMEARTIDSILVSSLCVLGSWSIMRLIKKNNWIEKNRIETQNAELKNYQQQLIKEKERAEQLSKTKTDFLSTMSHELRTPLNGVVGLTNLMLDNSHEGSKQQNLEILKFSAEHLVSIVNDILDYNKIGEGKISLECVEFNIKKILTHLVATYSIQAQKNNIKLRLVFPDGMPENLKGDPTRLTQILNNLTGNAIKFTNTGSVTIHIDYNMTPDNQVVVLFKIIDTGIGIADEMLTHIFDRFTQADNSTTRMYGGTGLGLSICKKLIELQGGSINVESEIGKGSTFSFDLKFQVNEEQNQLTDLKQEEFDLSSKRVLLVEDNMVNVMIASQFLKNWGLNVVVANDGVEAIDSFGASEFDIILMDIHMSRLDGYESTRHIRTMDAGKCIPIIALTASVAPDVMQKIKEVGMDAYILKPFEPDNLKRRIIKLLAA